MVEDIYSKEAGDKIEAGVLNLANVSVKDSGRSLSSIYAERRKQLLEPFAKMVKQGLLRASSSSSKKMQGFMSDLKTNGHPDIISETGQTQIYNSYCADLRNALATAKADVRYEKAWHKLITQLEVRTDDIKKELGRDMKVASGFGWYSERIPELLFSPLTVVDIWDTYSRNYSERQQIGVVSMHVSTRLHLCDLFFGKKERLPHLSETLPQGCKLLREDFEHATAADLMTLAGVALNGSMLSANGSITAATVKKIKSQTGISDFEFSPGQWPLDRVEVLCLTYFTLHNAIGKDDQHGIDIKRLAKFTVDHMARWIIGPMFGSFIPDMQGFAKVWTSGSYASRIAWVVQQILCEAKDEWMDLSNFKMQLLCSPAEGHNNFIYLKLFNEEGRRKGTPTRKSDKEKGVKQPAKINWWEEGGWKFAIHWIKYLCAMGIVELAMDPDASPDDPMEGMRYATLTPLGRYALNIDPDYTPTASEGNMGVDYDARNGIVTIDEKSPYQMFMDKVAKRISPTRFLISTESLLKGCKEAADLDQRINNLRVILDPDKEPTLKQIIEEAERHTYCAAREGGYSLLRLRPDLPGLREAILTNKELREMTILAGPTLALVKTLKMDRFNAICASYGYLMD